MGLTENKTSGIMCISLDTEFFWGVHDTQTYESYGENVYNGRTYAIDRLLKEFEKYGMHVTWAMVGAIMAKDKETLLNYAPAKDRQPAYNNAERSPYKLLDELGQDVKIDSLFLGNDIVEKIKNTANQHIGSHTFSHYYCKEPGQNKEQFDADIESAVSIAESVNVSLKSIVFPKNEIVKEYVESCRDVGIVAYRGIEENWIYNLKSVMMQKVLRFADSYFPLSGSNTYIPECKNGLINLRGSRFLRPYNNKLRFLETLKISRIKHQMKNAAKKGQIFHIWWHPHNFGSNLENNMKNLKKILDYYLVLKDRYGFESKSIEEIAEDFERSR